MGKFPLVSGTALGGLSEELAHYVDGEFLNPVDFIDTPSAPVPNQPFLHRRTRPDIPPVDRHQTLCITVVVHSLNEEVRLAFFWGEGNGEVFLEAGNGFVQL